MDKVILTKAQAEVLERYRLEGRTREGVVHYHIISGKYHKDDEELRGMSLDTLIRALYIGYEIELTVEEKLLEMYREGLPCPTTPIEDSAFREGMKKTCEIAGIKVKWARN